jgi:hypothetical protein
MRRMKRILAIVACTMLGGGVAAARDVVVNRRPTPPPKCDPAKDRNHCEKTINIDKALGIDGKLRQLSMLQFLERATQLQLELALEKKSFVPKLVQSVEEEAL